MAAMTLEEMRDDLGSLINQVDDDGAFSSTHITSTEADRWLNQAMEEIYMRYAMENREQYEQFATANTVEDQAVYTFGGDATDILAIRWLGIMYSSTDDDYTRARPRSYPDVMITGHEEFSESAPIYFRTTVKVGGVPTSGVRFPDGCVPDEAVTDGIRIMYIERPSQLSEDADEPHRIPHELHKYIVYGAAIKCFEKMEQDERAARMSEKYAAGIRDFIIEDPSKKADTPVLRIRAPRWDVQNFYKRSTYKVIDSGD